MTEFAIVSTVAIMLMFTMAEMGLIIFGNSAGTNAAREGARYGIINYLNADTVGSTNYNAIRDRVAEKLVGNVLSPVVTVTCRQGDSTTDPPTPTPCTTAGVDLLREDSIDVKVSWQHKGATPFVPVTSHIATARMVINGAPDLSTTATTATSSTTTTTMSSSTTTTTGAPAKKSLDGMAMLDTDADGKVDSVTVTFSSLPSGSLDAACASTSLWTLASVPGGGSLAGASLSGSVVTLTLNEGTADTALGSFTVAFAGCSNANAFAAAAPSDGAGPVFVSLTDSDTSGAGDGKLEIGDWLDLTFSEVLAPAWGASTSAAIHLERSGQTTLAFGAGSAVHSEPKFDPGNNYVPNHQSVTFGSGTITASGAVIRVDLGAACLDCANATNGNADFSFTPSGAIRDAAGNQAAGTVSPGTPYKLF